MGIFGGGGFFGGGSSESHSTSTSITQSTQADQRLGVEGGVSGQLVGPGSLQTNPNSIGVRAGDYSQISQNLSGDFKFGLDPDSVRSMLDSQNNANVEQSRQATQLASLSIGSLAASKGAEPVLSQYGQYVPWALGAIVAVAIVKVIGKRRK